LILYKIFKVPQSQLSYLTASSNWIAMPFLLLEGVTQMALMPQAAAVGSLSQKIAPSIFSESLTLATFLWTSLWKITFPNWRVVERVVTPLFFALWTDPTTEPDTILNAFSIGSATRHPTTLLRDINRYTLQRSWSIHPLPISISIILTTSSTFFLWEARSVSENNTTRPESKLGRGITFSLVQPCRITDVGNKIELGIKNRKRRECRQRANSELDSLRVWFVKFVVGFLVLWIAGSELYAACRTRA